MLLWYGILPNYAAEVTCEIERLASPRGMFRSAR
jgi:hypothetical protein